MRGHDIKELKAAITARGDWDRVFTKLTMGDALVCEAITNARPGGGIKHSDCPIRGCEKDFRVDRDFPTKGTAICTCGTYDVPKMLMLMNHWTLPRVCEELSDFLYGSGGTGATPERYIDPAEKARKEAKERAENSRRLRNMRVAWEESVALDHPSAKPARTYLVSRGLTVRAMSARLRYHPSQPYFDGDGKRVGCFPVIICKFVSALSGTATAMHRIYLSKDGRSKAPVDDAKKDMPKPSNFVKTGSAIFLDDPQEVLAIGEGIETMLAVRGVYPQLACWATATADMLAAVAFPSGLKELHIFADSDRSKTGERVAKELIDRCIAQDIKVFGYLPGLPIPPSKKGVDWLDVLNASGVDAFPNIAGFPKRPPTQWESARLAKAS